MTKRKHVLLVDDDADIRFISVYALEYAGYYVTQAVDGADALRQIEIERPDVVLIDMQMPIMSGLQFLEHVRADPNLSELPVVFLTANVQRHQKERYKEARCDGVIHKPFEPSTIGEQLRAILDGREG